MSGFSCQLIKTRFYLYCGSFSHTKFEKIPDVELSQSVGVNQCRKWTRNKVFKTKDGSKHPINVPGENILHINDLGVLDASGSVSCQGQSLKIGNNVVEQSVILSQYRVVIKCETFRLKTGANVEVIGSHTRLPRSCRPKSGSCSTDTTTYFWTPDLPHCKLEKLSTLTGVKVGNYIVDHGHKMVIKMLSAVPAPSGCGLNTVWQTPYHNVFVTEHSNYSI